MAIKTWNTDAEYMRLEKIKELKAQIKDLPCGRKACVGVDGDCPLYGTVNNCSMGLLLDELDMAENKPDAYKTYWAEWVLKGKENDVATIDVMSVDARVALAIEQNGVATASLITELENAKALAKVKADAFGAIKSRKAMKDMVK